MSKLSRISCLLLILLLCLLSPVAAATEAEECLHAFSAWEDMGSNHSGLCTLCGQTVTAEHTFEDYWTVDAESHTHRCLYCSHTSESQAHTWPETWEGDGSGHFRLCTVCQSAGQSQDHTLTEAKLVRWPLLYRSGRREQTCTVCGYLYAETVAPLKTLRIVLFCVAGVAVLTAATLFTIRLIKKKKAKQNEENSQSKGSAP